MWWALLLNSIVSILDSGVAASTTAYESIATITVGGGGAASIDFTSIPSTYTHLQIRGIARDARANAQDSMNVKYNNDSGNNYMQYHELYGDGTTLGSYAGSTSGAYISLDRIAGNTAGASMFGAVIIDILDYANTNKYKTQRSLGGTDQNGSGALAFGSGLWMSTSAINRITLTGASANFSQYSSFALYGIKGA